MPNDIFPQLTCGRSNEAPPGIPPALGKILLGQLGTSSLVVEFSCLQSAEFGCVPAHLRPPSQEQHSCEGWACFEFSSGDGRFWIPADEVPLATSLEQVSQVFKEYAALRSERDQLESRLTHFERTALAARVGLWEWEPQTGRAYSGNDCVHLLGYEPGEIDFSYETWQSLVHPEDLPRAEQEIAEFLKRPQDARLRIEYRVRMKSGEWRWTLTLGRVLSWNEQGEPLVVAGTHQSIHEERHAKMALKESEAYSRRLFNSSPECIKVVDLNGTLIDVSDGGIRLREICETKQLLGSSWVDMWDEVARPKATDVLNEAGREKSSRFRGLMAAFSGEEKWSDVYVVPLPDESGTTERALVTSRNITSQVTAEHELQRITLHMGELVQHQTDTSRVNESRLRSILASLDGMACRWNLAGAQDILFVSDGVRELLGIEPEELISADSFSSRFIHPADCIGVQNDWSSLPSKRTVESEFRVVTASGVTKWVHARLCLVEGEPNDDVCVDAVLTDITARREMMRTLALANHTLEESLVSVFWIDAQGRGLRANRATAKLLGYSRQELTKLDLSQVHPDLAGPRWAELWVSLEAQGSQQLHLHVRHRDGHSIPVFVFITLVEFEGKTICVGFASDESRRLAEAKARRQSELLSQATLGALVSRIAILDCDGTVLATNRAWTVELPGADKPRAAVGDDYLEMLASSRHPAASVLLGGVRSVLSGRKSRFDTEYLFKASDPALWMQLRVTRFGDSDDVRVVINYEDITRHKRVQRELDQSRHLFETLCRSAPVVIFRTDANGACRYLSERWTNLTGREAARDLGHSWLRAIHPRDYQRVLDEWRQFDGACYTTECRLLHADGGEIDAYVQAVRLESEDHGHNDVSWVGTVTDLTDIKQTTNELALVESRQRHIFEALPQVVYVLEPDDNDTIQTVWASSGFTHLGHAHHDGVPSETWWLEHLHPADLPGAYAYFRKQSASAEQWSQDYRLRRADGNYAWVADYCHAVRDSQGRLIEIVGSITDVSDRYAAEAALRESEANLRVAFDQAAVGMVHLGPEQRIHRPNRRLRRLLARPAEDLRKHDWSTLTHPEDRVRDAELLRRICGGKVGSGALDKRLLTLDGSALWVHVTYSLVGERSDDELRVFAVVEDISERRRIQGAANQALTTLDAIAEATFSFDPEHLTFFYVNDGAVRQTGFSRTDLLSMSLLDLQNSVSEADLRALLEQTKQDQQKIYSLETILVRNNGLEFPVNVSFRYIDVNGEPPYFTAVARDITERRQAQQNLENLNAELEERVEERTNDLAATNLLLINKEEQIRAIMENIPSCVVTIDRDGVITGANAAVVTVFGMRESGAVGLELEELVPGLFREIVRSSLRQDRRAEQDASAKGALLLKGTFDGRNVDGELCSLDVSVGFYELRGERHYAAIIRDIREELAAKRELMRARFDAEQANRAKSLFLATMSHELRTPMNGVLGMSELLLQSRLQGTEHEMVDTIQKSASVLLKLVDDILDFSKIEAGKLELELAPVELDRLLETVCANHSVVASAKHVDLYSYVSPETPPIVLADPVRVRQILHNLIGNAVKFSAGRDSLRGRVDVRVESRSIDESSVEVTLGVSDNGIGMDRDMLSSAFDPFIQADGATTRRFGGTGLGLSICKRLVELMEGEIVCQSAPDIGTSFIVALRLAVGRTEAERIASCTTQISMAAVLSSDSSIRTNALEYLKCMGVRAEGFEKATGAFDWLKAADTSHGTQDFMPALICDESDGSWQSLHQQLSSLHQQPVSMVIWSQGHWQSPRRLMPHVVQAGFTTFNVRGLAQALRMAASGSDTPGGISAAAPQTASQSPWEDVRLLIAEDHDINQKVVVQQLESLSLSGDVVADGCSALERWYAGSYSAVLIDLHMPGMDGYELAREIRRQESLQGLERTPLIAFTANAIVGDDAKCFQAGMDDVLTKPVKLNRLREVVMRWVAKGSGSVQQMRVGPPIDVGVLRRLVGGNEANVRDLLTDFTRSAGSLVHTVCDQRNLQAAAEGAHRLKASARSIGAFKLANIAVALEALLSEAEIKHDAVKMTMKDLEKEWHDVRCAVDAYMETDSEALHD